MNIYEFTQYVNLDIDDSYTVIEVAQWVNKGIANYNLIPPLTKYRLIAIDPAGVDANEDGLIDIYQEDVDLTDNFLLGIMLPFVTASIKSSEASVQEKQIMMQEFMRNAREYKLNNPIPPDRRVDNRNPDLENYKLGENVFLSRFDTAPFQAEWSGPSVYDEFVTNDEDE